MRIARFHQLVVLASGVLVASPACASDMTGLAVFVVVPPALLLAIVTAVAAFMVQRPQTQLIWAVILFFPTAAADFFLYGASTEAYHGDKLGHPELLYGCLVSGFLLSAAYVGLILKPCRPPA